MAADRIVLPISFEIIEKGGKRKKAAPGKGGTSGESNLISKVGVYHPRLHQKRKRGRRALPDTGDAPFGSDEDRAVTAGFGGQGSYTRPTGIQQERLSRRGNTRFAGAGPAFPGIKTFQERIADIEKNIKENKRKGREIQNSVNDKIDKIQQGADAITKPDVLVGGTFLKMLGKAGPYGAAVTAALISLVSAPDTVREIVRAMGVKGGPLNEDWHREIESELTGIFSFEQQKSRVIGKDSFVVSQGSGYRPIEGTDIYVSLLDRDEDRLARIGQDAKAKGIA